MMMDGLATTALWTGKIRLPLAARHTFAGARNFRGHFLTRVLAWLVVRLRASCNGRL